MVGEAAIAVAFLVAVASIYRFRTNLDSTVYRPFVAGFVFLYFSALQDFLDELVAVPRLLTYGVENGAGVVGAISLAVAFGYWTRRYDQRGHMLIEREERLRRRNEQLEALNRVVRHDIRNNLNLVLGMVESAADHVDEDGERYLERARRSAIDGVEVTRAVHELVESLDDGETALTPCSLRDVIEGQVERVQAVYPDARIRFDSGPEATVEVLANDALASVFRNLLVNAIQHNDKEAAEVVVNVETHGETATVSVADNGPGVPDEVRRTAFGRGETGMASAGTGVGLYLVDRLVSRYGGEVWIGNDGSEGATFNVRLRVAGQGQSGDD